MFTHNFLLHCIIGHDFLLKKSSNYVSLVECWINFVSLNPMMMIFYIYLYMACRLMYCISSFHEKSKSLHHKYDMWNLFDFLLVVTHHRKFKFVMVNIKDHFSKVHLPSQLLIRFMVLEGFRVESLITKHIFNIFLICYQNWANFVLLNVQTRGLQM